MYRNLLKRILDLVISTTFLVALSPFFMLLCLLLGLANNGNPFFIQERIGRGNNIFRIIKFKTMRDMLDDNGDPLSDDQRLTYIGKLVRRTSLDELPQLINIIKGDMSLVGPRPLLVEYLTLYSEDQIRRHEILPGITGWAQVNGRNNITWGRKFDLDVWYVNNLNFLLDVKILCRTVIKVFRVEDIAQKGHVSMDKFNGN